MLSAHLFPRERLSCPVLARAHAGNEASHRCEDQRTAYLNSLPAYQEIERIWSAAGHNLRTQIAGDYAKARASMGRASQAYRAAVAAEHINIDIRKAA